MIRAILLDIDGTLIDSNGAHAQSWVEALAERGIRATYEEVREKIGMGGDHLLPALGRGLSDDEEPGKTAAKRRGEIFRSRYLPVLKPFAGTRNLLLRFRESGFRLVAATSAPDSDLHLLLRQAGVEDLFDETTNADEVERSKPDPDIVRAALRKAGVKPHEAVMLGDTPYDVESAGRAGVPCIGLTCGGWSREALRGAIAVYEDPADLLENWGTSPLAKSAA
jgi:HAD superfamily hydrolase (TIGR01509 family)